MRFGFFRSFKYKIRKEGGICSDKGVTEEESMSFYDEVEIEDMEWDEDREMFTYPCPCGDLFQISKDELSVGEEVARCPSCSLIIRVVYDVEDFAVLEERTIPAQVVV